MSSTWDTSTDAYENELRMLREMREAAWQFAAEEASRKRESQEAGM
jgi:hypothetical protein